MKGKILKRSLVGASFGLLICQMIAIVISFVINDGNYYAVVPELFVICKSETTAVLVQTIVACIYGAVWGGESVIWEIDEWSLLKQTILHFVISSAVTFPVAYFTWWMPHTPFGVLSFFGIFASIYIIIWISQYLSIKRKIEKMNQKIGQRSQ